MSGALNLKWSPPGPVSEAFMDCSMDVQVINGPIGGGKTTTALVKAIELAKAQRPSTTAKVKLPGGGWAPLRKFKLCVVRDTYRQLWRSTLPSWFARVPKEVGTFTGALGAPAQHQVRFKLDDGTVADLHVDFIAIGENAAEDVMRGYEPTCFLLEEADLLDREVFTHAVGRTGRFPALDEGGATWHGILMSCNAPELNSWLYTDIFRITEAERLAKSIALFQQPGGLDPRAENLQNLQEGRGYYERHVRINPDHYVQRFVHNRPGFSRAGKPVYPEFKDSFHVARTPLKADPGLVLGIGLDAGMSPAAVIGQLMPNGQRRVLAELVSEAGTGPTRFSENLLRLLRARFADCLAVQGWADPSAAYGADKKAGELSWIEIVAAQTGIRIRPAPTNAPIPRWEAVRVPLTRLIDGEPAFLLSSECPVLREGFNALYRFRKIQGDAERYDEQAEKNDTSHPHDALQYWCSGNGGDQDIRARVGRDYGARSGQMVAADWDPLS
jgi:hypothetical protein